MMYSRFITLCMIAMYLAMFIGHVHAQSEEEPGDVATEPVDTSSPTDPNAPVRIPMRIPPFFRRDPVESDVSADPSSEPTEPDAPVDEMPAEEPTDMEAADPTDMEPTEEVPFESPCSENQTFIEVNLTPDDYPEEISWEITNLVSFEAVVQEQTESSQVCVDPGFYLFNITDAAADGLCCDYGEGSYQILVDGELLFESTGEYTSAEKVSIAANPELSEDLSMECADTDLTMHLVIVPDDFPEEVSWRIGVVATNESETGEQQVDWMLEDQVDSYSECLSCEDESTVFVLEVSDSGSDGLCCANGVGFFDVYINDELFHHSDGQFESNSTISIPCSA